MLILRFQPRKIVLVNAGMRGRQTGGTAFLAAVTELFAVGCIPSTVAAVTGGCFCAQSSTLTQTW